MVLSISGIITPLQQETFKGLSRHKTMKTAKEPMVSMTGVWGESALMQALAVEFVRAVEVIVPKYTASSSLLSSVARIEGGRSEVLVSDVRLSGEAGLERLRHHRAKWETLKPVEHLLGSRAVGVVFNGANGLKSISMQSLAKVYTGQAKDWIDVGPTGLMAPGKDAETGKNQYPITAYGLYSRRPAGALFDAAVFSKKDRPRLKRLPSTAEVIKAVRANPGAIGFVDLTQLPEDIAGLRILPVDQAYPTVTAIQAGKYPLVQPVYLYVNPKASEPTKRFVEFITTTGKSVENPYTDTIGSVTKTLLANGLLPVTKQSIDKLPQYIQSQPVDREEKEKELNPQKRRKKQPGKSAGGW